MLHIALQALADLFTLERLGYLALGVLVGLIVGLVPGLGGVAGMSLLLPFVYGMDPSSAMALMIGIMAANHTSDTFPAVLVGVPGSAGAGATVMDGYPLAKQGKAAVALGASFTASMLGGLIGAAVLFAVLPVFRPLILSFGSPELFMLTLLGISTVAILAKGRMVKGLLAAAFGLLLSTVGGAPASADYRYTFDWPYLSDGLNIALVAMAVFALPEFIDLLRRNKPISQVTDDLTTGRFDGAKESLKRPGLIARSSGMGALLGAIPGVGGSAVSWIVYGLTARMARVRDRFGKGDIRGVIAPEAANNAMEGGQLIPAIMFGIPGSGTTAVLLGGLVLVGLQPGPEMVSDANLPVVLTIVWSLAVANILATGVCFSLRNTVAKLCLIPARRLVPFLFAAVVLAVYQNGRDWGDIAMLLGIGAFSWFALQAGWSRAAFVVGFVLGPPAERYLWISMGRYDFDWLTRPGVVAVGIAIIAVLSAGLLRRRPKPAAPAPAPTESTLETTGSAK
ncbi:tripartite tricarboxylate transporter permease [Actinophytocola oryzae]|uniref:TctA family transporter n=1 Tax=Actinophytocola oryzae TaxID=502181 RepID=A0A4R7W6G1_9PSEU|nr:tripartite tricarboxylate transporter permease [Actinophytocola oryzae]TDV57748.1 TctA family transporter [Actinophytocola oryzae]